MGFAFPMGFFFYFFYFLFFNIGFCSGGILVGSGQWWHGGHGGGVVVVTGQWRRSDIGGRWRKKIEKNKKRKNVFYYVDILF